MGEADGFREGTAGYREKPHVTAGGMLSGAAFFLTGIK